MMSQTWALLIDAYRELNAKKLFWIVLVLSGLVVAAIAGLGNDEKGVTVLFWHLELPFATTTVVPRPVFYKILFIYAGIKVWLTWAATGLALVSTAGLIPEFISGGSIELALAKPIGRLRLFLTKYITGLMFVGLQVTVFCAGMFFVMGIRGGDWSWRVFLGIPVVLMVFSFLYSFCVLIGLLTRSTIAALLLTVLLWLAVFAVHVTEDSILEFKIRSELSVSLQTGRLAEKTSALEQLRADRAKLDNTGPDSAPPSEDVEAKKITLDAKIGVLEITVAGRQSKLESAKRSQKALTIAHAVAIGVKTVLPKTSESTGLLTRWLITKKEAEKLLMDSPEPPDTPFAEPERDIRVPERSIQKEYQKARRERSVGWILGTSLAFEVILLAFAGWIFCRRDF